MVIHDPKKLLEHLLAQGREKEWLEFKVDNFVAKTVGVYISALANSASLAGKECGYLVLGIHDATHEIVGTDVRIADEKVGNDTFLFWVQRQLTPEVGLHVTRVQTDGKDVEILVIEPSNLQPVEFQGEAYIRIDTSIQPLKKYRDRARSLWMLSSRYAFEDSVALANQSADWVLGNTLPRALIDGLNINRPTPDSVIDLLIAEGMLKDNFQGGLDATNLLGLTVAKNLGDWPSLETKAPRVVSYKGAGKMHGEDDVTGQLGYAASFPKLLSFIMDRVFKKEEILHGIRRTVFDIPEVAVREFLANALVHQDFTVREGGPFVEIFKDRIRITNPGVPLIDPDRFIDAPPKSRNPKLGGLMMRLGICEQRGSGVDRALKAIEDQMLPPPMFQIVENSTSVTIFGPKAFADLTREDRIRACYQHACVLQERNKSMSNATLRARFGLPEKQYPQVSTVIRDAIEGGRIRPLDDSQGNKNARYVPFWA